MKMIPKMKMIQNEDYPKNEGDPKSKEKDGHGIILLIR